ncbi:MAG: glycosyltransferase family 39 protein [Actinobacteria bacterium]|nr:glycosyltransferase family 39 protein [Actinomycetota bacterium]MCL5883505.1 glycosyltransferase family 39 protein [Actinomycetota bacterium]
MRLRRWLSGNRILVALLILAAAKSVLWVAATPPWRSPDSYLHFGYIEFLSREHTVPVSGRLDHYPDVLQSLERTNLYGVFGLYETHMDLVTPQVNNASGHPPLYYTLMLPAYWAASGGSMETQLYSVMLFTSIFSVLLVWAAYRLAREIFPGKTYMQIGVPLLLIFHPQLGFISSSVVQDSLLALLFTWLLYHLAVFAKGDCSYRRGIFIGATVGLGMLTKSSFMMAYPIGAAVFAVMLYTQKGRRLHLLKVMAAAAGISLLICGWFYVRNYIELGAAQPYEKTERYHAANLWTLWLRTSFRAELISSFLGNFSWLSIPLPIAELYWFRRILQLALAGFAAATAIGWWKPAWQIMKTWVAALMAGTFMVFLVAVSYFEITVGGSQGRYLFPAVFPFWALLLTGLVGWMPPAWRPRATAVVVSVAGLLFTWSLLVEFLPRVT